VGGALIIGAVIVLTTATHTQPGGMIPNP
jgi:hypothetical protein